MKNKKKQTGKNKEIIMDLPEVKDIPGQEHVKPPRIGEMIDSTPSSSDEEGEGVLDELNEDETVMDNETNVSSDEKKLLDQADRSNDSKNLQGISLDNTDGEYLLNEESDPMDLGDDLDVPGSELDDDNEELGEEDEENNSYSQKD